MEPASPQGGGHTQSPLAKVQLPILIWRAPHHLGGSDQLLSTSTSGPGKSTIAYLTGSYDTGTGWVVIAVGDARLARNSNLSSREGGAQGRA